MSYSIAILCIGTHPGTNPAYSHYYSHCSPAFALYRNDAITQAASLPGWEI